MLEMELNNLKSVLFEKANGIVSNFVKLCDNQESKFKITKLAGDASTRNYYRVSTKSEETFIVMELNLAKKGSEEGLTFNKNVNESKEYSFINIHRFLKSLNTPVPDIYHYSESRGILILEDLGDMLFQYYIDKKDNSFVLSSYKEAINVMVEMQAEAEKRARDNNCYAFNRAFDKALFNWEFDHFIEYTLKQAKEYNERQRIKVDPKDLKILQEKFEKISLILDNEPKYFNHRDYHSRNILVKNNKIFLIDFQDAILAPLYYDLASLLRDAYVTLEEEMIDELFSYYLEKFCSRASRKLTTTRERLIFDFISIQRNLKAIGRFYFIDKVKKNPNFLQYIPNTFNSALQNFRKYDDLNIIEPILKKYISELN